MAQFFRCDACDNETPTPQEWPIEKPKGWIRFFKTATGDMEIIGEFCPGCSKAIEKAIVSLKTQGGPSK